MDRAQAVLPPLAGWVVCLMTATIRSGRPTFYSVAETAQMFGTSEMTLYRAIHDGQFPAIRIRGRLIIPARVIEAMIDAAVEGRRARRRGELGRRRSAVRGAAA